MVLQLLSLLTEKHHVQDQVSIVPPFTIMLLNVCTIFCRGHIVGGGNGIKKCLKVPLAKREQLIKAYRDEEGAAQMVKAKKEHNSLPSNHTIDDLAAAAATLQEAQEAQGDAGVQLVKTVRSQVGSSQAVSKKQTTISAHFTAEKEACDMLVSNLHVFIVCLYIPNIVSPCSSWSSSLAVGCHSALSKMKGSRHGSLHCSG